ncbi:MAG: hypothetical protein IT406_03405 [Candidatus Yanofskybacteria bacterium]|nr:hypothetical protein [Candidatus Yanofskybacteria bacterium]
MADDQKINDKETKLSGHKRDKKQLHPPFAQIKFTPSSWINDRMPDMLWAVLLIGHWEREKALEVFRHVASFVEKNHDCYNITITGIGRWTEEKRIGFIKYLTAWNDGKTIKEALRPMMLFPEMPGFKEWHDELGNPDSEGDAVKIADALPKVMWHQSDEATDCRWVKLLCLIAADKMKFHSSIGGIDDTVRGVLEYPNFGDLRHIRPFIRASEIAPDPNENPDRSWSVNFWKVSFDKTACFPASARDKDDYDAENWEKYRTHYMEETKRIRFALIDHFLQTAKTTAIDARHEGVFGFAFYAFTLFTEIVLLRLDYSVTGHLTLRALVESYITFAYLMQKDDPELWNSFRGYGSGQAKLIYLKLQEMKEKPTAVNEEMMREIANEDVWQEFLSINIGHWDSTDLRKMSEEVGLKDVYDQYYNWTSGYIHANWAAMRESVYEKCLNPLHRLHRLPTRNFTKLTPVITDAQNLSNKIFELLSKAYPEFSDRIKPLVNEEAAKDK